MSQPTQQCPRRRWFQFSLRTVMIVVAAGAGLAFGYAKLIEPYRRQREAMEAITKLNGWCYAEDAPWWVRCFDSNAEDVTLVDLSASARPDEYIPYLLRFPRLQKLTVWGRCFNDSHLHALRELKSLRFCDLHGTGISDAGLADVAFLTTLWSLNIADTGITDDGLRHIAHLPELGTLCLSYTNVGDDGLAFLVDLPTLEQLDMKRTLVTDKGLEHLHRNRSLQQVCLSGTSISDKGIPALNKCVHLTCLALDRTGLSPEGITSLRVALPKCDIQP